MTKVNSTTAAVTLTGSATAHANANDISNISLAFANAAFTSGSAAGIVGSTQTGITIDFADPAAPSTISVSTTQIGLEDDVTPAYQNVKFIVTIDEPALVATTFNYSFTGGANPLATSGVDFSVPGVSDTIAIGQTSKIITVPVLSDVLVEGNETFTITISSPSPALTITNGTATGTIIDNDVAAASLTYTGSFAEASADNGSLTGSRTVTLTGDTFINAGGTLTETTHFTLTNKPSGVTAVMSIDGTGTIATLTLT